ncbi:MAG: sigma-70 family RNA polymerase sigma factor [Solirubrobacteraceae bacterium MAG38_C4-C5]|nr:sigma-70 family RNA polymerase sigma factor [Candidatus Siliceabacter maunaloa]
MGAANNHVVPEKHRADDIPPLPSSGEVADGIEVRALDPHQELALRRRLQRWSLAQRGVSPQDFDDLYQEAWCKLLEGERRGRRIRHREGALRWALHNSWMMENRRRRRRPTADALDSVSPDALAATNAADPPERVETLDTARRVCEALVPLTARQRRIVLLEIGALRPTEIQQQLGISKRTFYRDRANALRTIGARVGSILDAAHEGSDRSEAPAAA